MNPETSLAKKKRKEKSDEEAKGAPPEEEEFGPIDDELWASAQLSHKIDEALPPPPRPPSPVLRDKDYADIPSHHVRAILIGIRRYSTLLEKLAVVDVPSAMTIKELRRELYTRANLDQGNKSPCNLPSQEKLRDTFCDYEFSLCRHIERAFGIGEPLRDSSICGDCCVRNVLAVQARRGDYSGSIRTLVPRDQERQEKHRFMSVVRSLPQKQFNLVVLSVGAHTPEQVLPNFAIEAAKNNHRVCLLSVNPGFYHGLYRKLDGRMCRESTMSFLAYCRHPPGRACETELDHVRAWESWRQTDTACGDFAGSFVLHDRVRRSRGLDYMEMHTFGMSWPGKPANRDLDGVILHAVSETIPSLCTPSCHFVPIFTTWSDETDFHVSHLCKWRAQASSHNSFHAILEHGHVFRNIDQAISNPSEGLQVNSLSAVHLEDLGI